MSKMITPSFVDPLGGLMEDGRGREYRMFGRGTAIPTDAGTGWREGALFWVDGGTAGAQLYINEGTAASCDFNVVTSTGVALGALTATAAELNYLDQDLATNKLTRGTGVDTSEDYHAAIERSGGLIITRIFINIDDLVGSTTDLDIIGESATANCHWGQITAAKSGTIFGGKITCLEVPTGGTPDIDFYASDVATGTENVIITDAALGTETALVTAGGAWTMSAPTKALTGLPAANDYIYVVNGAGGVPATFTAGKFLIELYGK